MKKLSLETLKVESFAPEAANEMSYDFLGKSRNYTDCGSCGIACTAIAPC